MNKKCDDLLNLLAIKYEEVLTATYYNVMPKSIEDSGVLFQYDIVDESDKSYSKVLDTIKTELAVCTIKTNDMCGFKVNGYVVTQDGNMWQISGIIKRVINSRTKQALRLLKETAETEYIIRLIQIPNPRGLK